MQKFAEVKPQGVYVQLSQINLVNIFCYQKNVIFFLQEAAAEFSGVIPLLLQQFCYLLYCFAVQNLKIFYHHVAPFLSAASFLMSSFLPPLNFVGGRKGLEHRRVVKLPGS